MANEQNLKPIQKGQLSSEEAKKRGMAGAIKSAEVRKEKKLMSQIYAEFLANTHDIKVKGNIEKMTGNEMISKTVKAIIETGGRNSVTMMKEIREATEGSKTTLAGDIAFTDFMKNTKNSLNKSE